MPNASWISHELRLIRLAQVLRDLGTNPDPHHRFAGYAAARLTPVTAAEDKMALDRHSLRRTVTAALALGEAA